jgi:hypothetical protein
MIADLGNSGSSNGGFGSGTAHAGAGAGNDGRRPHAGLLLASMNAGLALVLAGVLALALASSGCADKSEGDEAGEASIPPTSADLVYADGWTELALDANSAKNRVDTMGHYHTDKNYCQKPGEGVYSVAAWNRMSATLNKAVTAGTLSKARCWDSPNGSKFYNKGIAELSISRPPANNPGAAPVTSKRVLFEYKSGQICTTLDDATLADSLMEQIEMTLKLTDKADAQDCPGYRPEG